MANRPRSFPSNAPKRGPSGSTSRGGGAPPKKDPRTALAELLVNDLTKPERRENALFELSKKRDLFHNLAPLLWNSYGSVAVLLQEIISIYPLLSPPALTSAQSNRVCNVLALLQSVAATKETKFHFLNAHIPLYLYPFLKTTEKSRHFEHLRLTSLGVIGSLVKVNDPKVVSFLLSTEVIPLCLQIMERDCELAKTVATYIMQKILMADVGLDYICATPERFFALGRALGTMVGAGQTPSAWLLKHTIRCYLRLTDNPRACDALNRCFPDTLKGATFDNVLRNDAGSRALLQHLCQKISVENPYSPTAAPPATAAPSQAGPSK